MKHKPTKILLPVLCGLLAVIDARATTVSINFDTDPLANGVFQNNYQSGDNGTLTLMAGAWVTPDGSTLEAGVGDQSTNGYWAITQTTPTNSFSSHGMRSVAVLNEIDPGYAESSFSFAADVRLGGGSAIPADGFSISFARNSEVALSSASEKGTATGLSVCFLAYNGDSATGIRGLQINIDGSAVYNMPITNWNGSCGDATSLQTGPTDTTGTQGRTALLANLCWQPILITYNSGLLSVGFKGITLVTNLAVPYTASPGKFVIAGRTGGLWEEQDIDNIVITTVPSSNPVISGIAANAYSWNFKIYDSSSVTPNTNSIAVLVDGVSVTPTRITQSGNIGSDGSGATTVFFESATPIFASGTLHTNTISFNNMTSGSVFTKVPYTVGQLNGAVDRVHHYLATFRGAAQYSASATGHSGVAGDYAVQIGTLSSGSSGNSVWSSDPNLMPALNAAMANDQLTVSMWVRRNWITNTLGTSDIWIWSQSESQKRGLNLHGPYTSGGTFYYDTGGFSSSAYRISSTYSSSFDPSYYGGDWWTNWHNIVLVKNGGDKQIWIDSKLFLEQTSGAAPLLSDMAQLFMGSGGDAGGNPSLSIMGSIDDYAFFSTPLASTDIAALFNGTPPNQISGASTNLIAWWDFNDVPDVKVAQASGKSVVTFNQLLQTSTNLAGPFKDAPAIASPYTNNPAANPVMFFRARKY